MKRSRLSLDARERVALVVIGAAFLFLLGGLVKLQLFDHQKFAKQSENNRIRVVPIPARRGNVYDREGRVLIDNRPSYTVSVVPAEEIKGRTVPALAPLIGLDTLQIRNRIKRNLVSRYQPAAVKKDIPFEVVAVLEEQSDRFAGVSYQMERVRQYVADMGVESYTGYVGETSEEELARTQKIDLRPGSMIGKKGLERRYDDSLRGREGTAYIEVSATGQILGSYEGRAPVEPVPGSNLILSIDLDLQAACVASLDTFCCGAIVALDPRNGELLAMISRPGYDPNIFSSVIPEDIWQQISNDPNHPLLNRPLAGLYSPGSTTKFITVGAGMEEGIINEHTTFSPCLGGYQFGNRFFRCWLPAGHGRQGAVGALEQSCDTYMYQLGLKIGIDKLSEYYAACGFGKVTEIDIPSEAAGLNPNTAYYDSRYGKGKWSRGLVLNLSIGQGELLTTPLQLAQFFCGLVNKGIVYRPHILKKVSPPRGPDYEVTPEVSFRLPFSAHTLDVLLDGMRAVVAGEHGTAKGLRNDLYAIGGKTGTVQNPHGLEHSWFVGVAPFDDPEIVVAAIMENAGHGSEVAAPVVGKVIRAYMEKKLHGQSGLVKTEADTTTLTKAAP